MAYPQLCIAKSIVCLLTILLAMHNCGYAIKWIITCEQTELRIHHQIDNSITFLQKYQLKTPTANVEQFCEHIFRTFDTDKNGYIDFKEFMKAINITASGTPEEKLKWTFHMYDVDGSGVVDLQEMTKIVEAIYKTDG